MRSGWQVARFAVGAAVSALARRRVLNCLWELTYRCNAKCAICSYWKSPGNPADELGLNGIREGLRRIYRYGCRLINFTGGEPTLRSDLVDIVGVASSLGMWTSVVTNGSLMTRERLGELKAAGLDHLLLSLDSTDARLHDAHRRIPGCHDRVRKCLEWLAADFLTGCHTGGIMCAISNRNAGEIEGLLRLAEEYGVYAVFQPYHSNKTGDPELNAGAPAETVDRLLRDGRRSPALLNSSRYLAGFRDFCRGWRSRECAAGRKYFSVDPYGFLHPCVDTPAVGHVLHSDLAVLRSPASLAAVSMCRGCWYCFRGEADSAMSAGGCLERVRMAGRVLLRNRRAKPAVVRQASARA